jgi:hypothetical protein
MKIPTVKEAESFLSEGEIVNPGRWVSHAKNAGLAAKLIAEKTADLDPETAYIFGILHDIGRKFGIRQMSHVLEGYKFLMEKGFSSAARISLTHSFPLKNIKTAIAGWDCTKEEFDFIQDYISNIEYNDYDRLIQLCDYLSLYSGFTIIEKRMIDIILRYGTNELTQIKFKEVIKIKEYFDKKVNGSIYSLLPDLVETTFNFKYTY